ncbi:MAG: Rpn family recombination-promoting nuclease/putative transposase [Lachnospiraceae bacterium]|nr:Rpn family recombination-promoting nuclease/putative transposase [Lachnospiraceae bacterium]
MNKTGKARETISNSKASDSGAKLIFGNATLCAQLLRDYSDIDILKDVRAEDIVDVTERFIPMFTEERNADVVKEVHLPKGDNLVMITLIEHKSETDYNVVMQLLRYMLYIWEDYEKRMESEHKGISRTKDFKYPPILPIVYYEGAEEWKAETRLKERVLLNDVFEGFIPDFCYKLIQINSFGKEDILKKDDELSLIMLINRLQRSSDFRRLDIPDEYLKKISDSSPQDVMDVIARVVETMLRRINVPEDEVQDFSTRIKEKRMGQLFENFEPYDVQATRAEARALGVEEGIYSSIEKMAEYFFREGKADTLEKAKELAESILK